MTIFNILNQKSAELDWNSFGEVLLSANIQTQLSIIEQVIKEYARIKCLETIRNVRHKAVDILIEEYQQASVNYIANQIQNIPNQDVMPEL